MKIINKIIPAGKKDRIIFAVSMLIVTPLIYFNLLNPYFRKWSEQSAAIKERKVLWKKAKDAIGRSDELTEKFSMLSKKIQAKLPPEREESQFLTEIGRVAHDTNVHIVTMNPLPFKDIGSFKEFSVEIDMEANLGNLVRFLYQMRKSSVALVANRLRLRPKSERSALLKGHLIISTIFLKK
jgi:hypothetical protein